MSYIAVENELKTLPEEYLDDVAKYIQLLKYKISCLSKSKKEKKLPILGLAQGKYSIPDDINKFDDEISHSRFINSKL